MADDLGFDENDDMDFDDDDDGFEDDMDFDMDMFAEPPMPKGRHPLTHSLIKTGTSFKDAFTDDKVETAGKFIKASIPSSISNEASQIGSIVGAAKEGLDESLGEIKKEVKPLLKMVDSMVPKGGKLETLLNIAKEKVGLDDREATSEELAADAAAKASGAVLEALGEQQDKEILTTQIRESIQSKRDLTAIELQGNIATNLEFLNKFNQDIVVQYQRKSLELQYRHLFTADEQLEVTKTGFDTFKNQLESIVINSALPDLVKTKNSEYIKQKILGKMTDGLFGNVDIVGKLKSRFKTEIKDVGSMIAGGVGSVASGIESAQGMSEMSAMAGGKEGMAGGFLADTLIGKLGGKVGDLLGKTEIGKSAVGGIQNLMLNPAEYLKSKQAGMKDGMLKDFFGMASDVTDTTPEEKSFSIEKVNRDEVALFDGKTQNSITKIIPGLLSKILSEVTGIRTGEKTDELRFDYDKGTFETTTDMKKDISNSINKSLLNSGVTRTVKDLVKDIEDKTSLDISSDELDKLKEGILLFSLSGKSMHPDTMEDNGFYNYFSKDLGEKLKSALSEYMKASGEDPTVAFSRKKRLTDDLNSVISNAPDPMEIINKYNDAGSMDVLQESGLMKYNETSSSYSLDNSEYKKVLGESIKLVDDDDVVKEKTGPKGFARKQAEKYAKRQAEKRKEKEAAEARGEVYKSNTGKLIDNMGEKFVNGVNTTTGYMKNDLSNDMKTAYDATSEFITGDVDSENMTLASAYKNTKDMLSKIKSVDDVKKLLKDTKIFKTTEEKYKALDKIISESENPKQFFNKLKNTKEYQALDAVTKDKLKRSLNAFNKVKTAVGDDLENTAIGKKTKELSETATKKTKEFVENNKNVVVKKATAIKDVVQESKIYKDAESKLNLISEEFSKLTSSESLNSFKNDLIIKIDELIKNSDNETLIKNLADIKTKIIAVNVEKLTFKEAYKLMTNLSTELFNAIKNNKTLNSFIPDKTDTVDELIADVPVTKHKRNKVKKKTRRVIKKGFKKGGYTGAGDVDEVAGIVHKDEEVVNSKKLDKIEEVLPEETPRHKLVDSLIGTVKKAKKDYYDDTIVSKKISGLKMPTIEKPKFLNRGNSIESDVTSDIDYSEILTIEDDSKRNLAINEYIFKINKELDKVDNLIIDNPGKYKTAKIKVNVLRNKLIRLTKVDDSESLKTSVTEINALLAEIVNSVTPNSSIITKNVKGAVKQNKEEDPEASFLEILNSDDPIGAMSSKLKDGVKSKAKAIVVGGAKKLFIVGKNIVKADLARGKKLRGFLKDKLSSKDEDGEQGFIGRNLNKGINGVGSAIKGVSSFAKDTVESDLENGKNLRENLSNAKTNIIDKPKNLLNKGIGVIGGLFANKSPEDKDVKEIKKVSTPTEELKENSKTVTYKNLNKKGSKRKGKSKTNIKKAVVGIAGSSNKVNAAFDKDGSGRRDGSWMDRLKKDEKETSEKNDGKEGASEEEESSGLMSMLTGALAFLGPLLSKPLKMITNLLGGLGSKIVKGLGSLMGGIFDKLGSVLKGPLEVVKNFASKGLEKATSMASSALSTAKGAISKVGSKVAGSSIGQAVIKTASKAKSAVLGVGSKIAGSKAGQAVAKVGGKLIKKVGGSSIMKLLKGFGGKIIAKLGKKAGKTVVAKLAGKVASRLIPFAGTALLAYDAGKIGYDMLTNGTKLSSAISKQILGFDLFSDDDLPKDENGDPIKPDEEEPKIEESKDDVKDETLKKEEEKKPVVKKPIPVKKQVETNPLKDKVLAILKDDNLALVKERKLLLKKSMSGYKKRKLYRKFNSKISTINAIIRNVHKSHDVNDPDDVKELLDMYGADYKKATGKELTLTLSGDSGKAKEDKINGLVDVSKTVKVTGKKSSEESDNVEDNLSSITKKLTPVNNVISKPVVTKSTPVKEFKKGGYTGAGDVDEVAGIVHKDEEVVNSKKLDKIETLLTNDVPRHKLVDELIDKTIEHTEGPLASFTKEFNNNELNKNIRTDELNKHTTDVQIESVNALKNVNKTLNKSLNVQQDMLEALNTLTDLNKQLLDKELVVNDNQQPKVENKKDNGITEKVGHPDISVKRKRYAS